MSRCPRCSEERGDDFRPNRRWCRPCEAENRRAAYSKNIGPTLDEIRKWPATCDIRDAAAALGISRSHAYVLIKDGVFPIRIFWLGSALRISTASLIDFLTNENHVTAVSDEH